MYSVMQREAVFVAGSKYPFLYLPNVYARNDIDDLMAENTGFSDYKLGNWDLLVDIAGEAASNAILKLINLPPTGQVFTVNEGFGGSGDGMPRVMFLVAFTYTTATAVNFILGDESLAASNTFFKVDDVNCSGAVNGRTFSFAHGVSFSAGVQYVIGAETPFLGGTIMNKITSSGVVVSSTFGGIFGGTIETDTIISDGIKFGDTGGAAQIAGVGFLIEDDQPTAGEAPQKAYDLWRMGRKVMP